MRKNMTFLIGLAAAATLSVSAQEASWNGEGSLSAGSTTGNTDTSDIGIGIDVARTAQLWTVGGELIADYAQNEGEETKNRTFLAGQLDRQLTDRAYSFGRVSHERDEFSGFTSRTFAGVGAGYQVFASDRTNWTVEGGPGIKIDEIEDITVLDVMMMEQIEPGDTVESFSVIGASNYAFDFNDAVRFTNDTNAIYAEESTQFSNITAITASLTNAFSARVSFDVRHDTNPPIGFESTDTATRVSLVYAIGDGE